MSQRFLGVEEGPGSFASLFVEQSSASKGHGVDDLLQLAMEPLLA